MYTIKGLVRTSRMALLHDILTTTCSCTKHSYASIGLAAFSKVDMLALRYTSVNFAMTMG